jgi:hypothetical protein
MEASKLLSAVVEQLAKKDVAMGDLLQLMEPAKGKDAEVDACSDSIEAIQVRGESKREAGSIEEMQG